MIRAAAVWVLSAGLAAAQISKPEEAALLTAEFDLWQRAAIALVRQHGGSVPDAEAALFALGRIADGDDAMAIEQMLPVARTWLLLEALNGLPRRLIDTGVDGDLARLVLCYVAGEGPGPVHGMIARWGLPRHADGCEARFADRLDAAAKAYRAYSAGPDGKVSIRYGDDGSSRLAARHGVLEWVADGLKADFAWPAGVTLEIVPCVAGDAGPAPSTTTVTVCADWIRNYRFVAAAGDARE